MNLPAPEIKVFCEQCGAELDSETADEPDFVPTAAPSPECGHEARTVTLTVDDQFGVIDQIRGTLREHGIKHWSKKFKSGEEYYRDTNEVRTVLRVEDWKNRHDSDSHYELITKTNTGVLIKRVKEALVKHREHGSAKRKIPDFPDEWRRVAAYYIWEKEGRPNGRHINHWNQAKAQLKKLWKAGFLSIG
jgi:Protein of unknown function (DUF2934)